MNYEQLYQEFALIGQIKNPLEQIVELKKFNKKYKKSEFYKHTHLSVYDAFKISQSISITQAIDKINYLLSEDNLSNYINGQLEQIDFGLITTQLSYGINYDKIQEVLKTFMPDYSVEQIQDMVKELKDTLEHLVH